jgi:hypothetical protein
MCSLYFCYAYIVNCISVVLYKIVPVIEIDNIQNM